MDTPLFSGQLGAFKALSHLLLFFIVITFADFIDWRNFYYLNSKILKFYENYFFFNFLKILENFEIGRDI
jgi:hypothetical protein